MMKLIIPIKFYVKGGVERVIIGLLSHLISQVEQIVVLANPQDIDYFKTVLPASERIIYEIWDWPKDTSQSRLISLYNRGSSISQKLKFSFLAENFQQKERDLRFHSRLNYLIDKYQITHCLYIYINRLEIPKINIPLIGIAYDVFWRFAPLTYAEDYATKYDQSLLEWLQKADLICTISDKTREDILSIFPDPKFATKVQAVPLAGFPSHRTQTFTKREKDQPIIFYFPSSFGIYKDHLTLIKAGLKLAQKSFNFQIIFIGKETDNLINGTLTLSQQLKTQEYGDYLQECTKIYQENQSLIEKYFKGLGYCDYETVEYYYDICSCVVVPSKFEGFGLAISEAIVRGLPVISTDLAVFKEQAEVYHCQDRISFFPAGDADALASCLEDFIHTPKERLPLSEVEERFSHWTWQDVAQKYVTLMKEIEK